MINTYETCVLLYPVGKGKGKANLKLYSMEQLKKKNKIKVRVRQNWLPFKIQHTKMLTNSCNISIWVYMTLAGDGF